MNQKMYNVLEKMKDYMQTVYGDDLLLSGGPGHAVFDDYNLDDGDIAWAIRYTDEFLADIDKRAGLPVLEKLDDPVRLEILETTKQFLLDLLNIPEEERYVYEEADFEPAEQPVHEWRMIGRAVEVNVDRLSDDNLVVIYYVYGEDVPILDKDGFPVLDEDYHELAHVEVRALHPQRLYENVSRYSLARLAAFMERADSELVAGQASELREYLAERTSKLN